MKHHKGKKSAPNGIVSAAQQGELLRASLFDNDLRFVDHTLQLGHAWETPVGTILKLEHEWQMLSLPPSLRKVFSNTWGNSALSSEDIQRRAGVWLLMQMEGNRAETIQLLAKILKLRKKGKTVRELKQSELGLKNGSGRKNDWNALENILGIALGNVGRKYAERRERIPRDELREEINRIARGNGLGDDYEIQEKELSRWISHFKVNPYMRQKKRGPEIGSRQGVSARRRSKN